MKTKTKQDILSFVLKQGPVGPTRISYAFCISTQMVHRHLNDLLFLGKVKKVGTPPKVLYFEASHALE